VTAADIVVAADDDDDDVRLLLLLLLLLLTRRAAVALPTQLLETPECYLRLTRKGPNIGMHYSLTGAPSTWRLVRACAIEGLPATVSVGIHAQAPFTAGCSAYDHNHNHNAHTHHTARHMIRHYYSANGITWTRGHTHSNGTWLFVKINIRGLHRTDNSQSYVICV
jgi:hypothetical protein